MGDTYHSIKTILKLVTGLFLNIALAYCLTYCVTFYLEYPTYTDVALVDQTDAIFPAITFCPGDKAKLKGDVLKVLQVTSFDYILHID